MWQVLGMHKNIPVPYLYELSGGGEIPNT